MLRSARLERGLGRSICPVAIALTSNGDVHFGAVLGDTLIQYCSATQDNLEKNKRASWHRRSGVRKGDACCSDLYINYNPATLIQDEQSLMRARYEVDAVFGTDGVMMACGQLLNMVTF